MLSSRVSFIVPVYNEEGTILEVLNRLDALGLDRQVIVVDDGSKDGTAAALADWERKSGDVLLHQENRGKGAAIRAALSHVDGDVVVIQDADLEVDPRDVPALVRPIEEGSATVVYGSRFLGGRPHHCPSRLHALGNRGLNLATNALFGTRLTDMETCYKVMPTDVARGLELREDRFGFEPEVTAQLCLRGHAITELPISYQGRTRAEGKKITWRDGFEALGVLVRVWWRGRRA